MHRLQKVAQQNVVCDSRHASSCRDRGRLTTVTMTLVARHFHARTVGGGTILARGVIYRAEYPEAAERLWYLKRVEITFLSGPQD